jgi:hypothetical protein
MEDYHREILEGRDGWQGIKWKKKKKEKNKS